ncbi:MAG: DUF1499 domain-containing protein [Gammaproteobacteria bacterium]
MNTLLVAIVLLPVVAFAALGWWSGRTESRAGGLQGGQLAPCGVAPNCVASENVAATDATHAVVPLTGSGNLAWRAIEEAVHAAGGHIVTSGDDYLHATFTSRLFRFVDDLELRRDGDTLHWRSASRVGYSDLGANRRRIEDLRRRLTSPR